MIIYKQRRELLNELNCEITFLTCWINALDVEYGVFACRCDFDHFLKSVDRVYCFVVGALDYETAVDARTFEGAIIHFDYLESIVDVELLFLGIGHWAELAAEDINIGLLNRFCCSLSVLEGYGSSDFFLLS